MLQDAVGHHASEIAGAGNEDPFQPDAGAPAALEQLAHRLARGVGEHDVEDEEQRPDRSARPRYAPRRLDRPSDA